MKLWIASILGLPLVLGIALAQEPVPVGEEFQVNSYTTSYQTKASVAVDPDGDFVVVWESDGSYSTDTSYRSIQAQRYYAAGISVGGQFQVNTYTTKNQRSPAVAVGATGDFVVVWVRCPTAQCKSVHGQRYDATGTPVGEEFQINTYLPYNRYRPDVTIDPQGNFVVVWEGYVSYTDTSRNIQGQRYDASGNPVGGEFRVNSYTTNWQENPTVAADAQGNFVVVWDSPGSYGTDTSDRSIQGQRYDANGFPVGGQFQINTDTTYDQYFPDVAVNPQGDFVVVWETYIYSYQWLGVRNNIQGQRYDVSGNPVGGEFQVNSYTTFSQMNPAVAADAQGDFVVVWESWGSYGTEDYTSIGTQGQRYDASGNPEGREFQVNTYTTNNQYRPSVAVSTHGDFVVVWDSSGSYGTDTSYSSIQGQRFGGPAVVSANGFESGDFSGWDSVFPPPVP